MVIMPGKRRFLCSRTSVIDLIDNDQCIWEQGPLKTLAKKGQLSSFKHRGFWQPMDTIRDRQRLEDLWQEGNAPWKIWGEI